MKPETSLLTHFIRNNDIVSTCDFISHKVNTGVVIYEVLRVIDGIPLFYGEHIDRLLTSISNLGFKISTSKKSISLRISALIKTNGLKDGNIRFQFSFINNKQADFNAWVTPFFYPAKELYTKGVSLSTISAQRENPNNKVLNPTLKSIVNNSITESGNYDVLLINKKGIITEGSRSNIFFIKGRNLITPKTSSVLPGITRQKTIDIAGISEVNFNEEDVVYNSLSFFDGAFITGTSSKILPVKSIDDVFFDPQSAIIKLLMTEYNHNINEYIQGFSWEEFIK